MKLKVNVASPPEDEAPADPITPLLYGIAGADTVSLRDLIPEGTDESGLNPPPIVLLGVGDPVPELSTVELTKALSGTMKITRVQQLLLNAAARRVPVSLREVQGVSDEEESALRSCPNIVVVDDMDPMFHPWKMVHIPTGGDGCKGGLTLAYSLLGTRLPCRVVNVAVAWCNPKQVFSKSQGTLQARMNIQEGRYVMLRLPEKGSYVEQLTALFEPFVTLM